VLQARQFARQTVEPLGRGVAVEILVERLFEGSSRSDMAPGRSRCRSQKTLGFLKRIEIFS
jgi:hypothetical protein